MKTPYNAYFRDSRKTKTLIGNERNRYYYIFFLTLKDVNESYND